MEDLELEDLELKGHELEGQELKAHKLKVHELYLEYSCTYFPFNKRRKIEKRLEKEGIKLKGKNLEPSDRILEKCELEAHILGKTVIVDDGTERKVYSSCVFEGVKRYNCNVCIMSVYGKTALIHHNSGRKHYEMMKRKSHPHQNFDEHKIVNLDSGMKPISTSDCFIVKELLDECRKRNIIHVLMGLEYLVEVHDPREPYYHCLLCNKKSDDIAITMDHLQSVGHRMVYLLLFFPKVYTKLLLLKREIRYTQLSIIVEKIEKKFGRLKPWRHEGALSLKQKRAIYHAIDSGFHLRDNPDLSFSEDIAFNDRVKNTKITDTVITEFLINENEDYYKDIFERQKGGVFRCKLCKVKLDTQLSRITHPFTGRHLEKTVKGIAIYDSVLCQIQSVLDCFPQPLIGTEYIVEYDEQGVNLYHCMLCRKAMNNPDMVTSHLVSKAHRQRYIKHHMPKKDEELLKLSGPVRAEEIEKLFKTIEAKFGRLAPFGSLFSLEYKIDSKRTVKDLISEKIINGKHLTVDERGCPKIMYGMAVPLFPKEGQAVPEAQAQTKKRKKKPQRRSSSVSPKRRRSFSSSSSRSLSPVARQRGLSPEPGPSTSYLPQEVMPPPAKIQNWLNLSSEPSIAPNGFQEMTEKSIADFFRKCDEENWQSVNHDHRCPVFSASHRLEEAMRNDDVYFDIRKKLIIFWLKNKTIGELHWSVEDLDVDNIRFINMTRIMDLGQLCGRVCRPLCRELVYWTAWRVVQDFPDIVKQMTEDEVLLCSRGLLHISNWFYYILSLLEPQT